MADAGRGGQSLAQTGMSRGMQRDEMKEKRVLTETGREEIRTWVRERMPDVVRDLERICRIRSVAEMKGAEREPFGQGCVDVLEEMLQIGRENGFFTHNYDDYVGRITLTEQTDMENGVGIWAHLDVVNEGEGWEHDPYTPVVKDGYMIARGCQDNKSSAIIGLYVLKYMKEHDIMPSHPLGLYLGTCEEQGMYDIDYYLEHYAAPTLSLVPDSGFPVCCGERGSFNGELKAERGCKDILDIICDCGQYTVPDKASVVLRDTQERWEACGGLGESFSVARQDGRITITASGISTQAANPEKGDSALTRLAELMVNRKLAGEEELEAFRLVCDMNRDHHGTALNVYQTDELSGPTIMVATQMRMEEGRPVIGFISKYPFTCSDFPYEENTRAVAEERGFSLKTTRLARSTYFNPDREVVRLLTDVSNEILGRQDKPFVMSGGTYARKLPNALAFGAGMPLPPPPEGMFAPGHGDYHQPDESIRLERIQKGLEVYICGLLELDGVHNLLDD